MKLDRGSITRIPETNEVVPFTMSTSSLEAGWSLGLAYSAGSAVDPSTKAVHFMTYRAALLMPRRKFTAIL